MRNAFTLANGRLSKEDIEVQEESSLLRLRARQDPGLIDAAKLPARLVPICYLRKHGWLK
ncbi:MAG: hypothetical protein WCK94_08240 [Comamonadaceae bacterium]